ncbi:DUF4192 family protein [Agromyces ramosus]|uniref:DUF4192 family protein n=1 Tax=Agromyces ramosus TaxID=33879 RepID=A0ABU0RBV0_9MICO|nr:DUF4192 family protein [Agromyces ramosus]MDQ0895543.1 hypothetical protein [Agromyces ramosus]
MTTIIRAEQAHDFLALVPTLAGFRPERSVVCVGFRGNRTVGVLRHDLPRRARDRAPLVSVIIGTLCRMPGVDAVVPIVYSDERFASGRGMPERVFLGLLVKEAERAGFLVRDALCRAADAWGSMFDRATPATGHPLALIDESPVTQLAPEEVHVLDAPESAGGLPESDAATADAIAVALGRFADDAFAEAAITRLGRNSDPVELVESLLARPASRQPVHRLAWFLHLASRPAFRDAMMLQFAFGVVVGETAHDDAVESAERAALHGESMDELVERELAEGGLDPVSDLLSRLLLGQSMLRPDRARVEDALALLLPLIANAPPTHRVGPLCIAAWLSWSLGRGSAAGSLIDRALRLEPVHPMANLLATFIGSGALPEWAFARAVPVDVAEERRGARADQ